MITAASQPHSNTNCSIPPQPGHAWWSEGFPVVFHSFMLSCSEKPRSTASLWQCKLSPHYGLELSASSCLCSTPPPAKGSVLTLSQQQAAAYCFWWLTPKTVTTRRRVKKGTPLSTCIKGFISYFLSLPPTPLPAPVLEVYVPSPSRVRDMQGRGWQGTD